MIWQDLREAAVRDLAWSCFGPPLLHSAHLAGAPPDISHCQLQLDPARQQWLRQLDKNPAALLDHLGNSSQGRLGIYFEKLWHFFLGQDPGIELLAHNLPVREAGQTLGEFDCIYFCKQRRQAVHLELAVKFYLQVEGKDLWLGPGCRDHLQQKVDRLLQHQVQLGQTPAGRAALERLGVADMQREIEMRGHLFAASQNPPLPDGYNRNHPLGHWYHWQDFLAGPAPVDHWVILPREAWLAPCNLRLEPDASRSPASEENLAAHFRDQRRPLQLATCDDNGHESRRCFVTSTDWPYRLPDQ